MQNKILGKKESIFIISLLTIVCILCFVQFIISLVSISDFVNMIKMALGLPSNSFKELNVLKAVSILIMSFAILLLLLSFILLFIRKQEVKRIILITIFTVLFLCVTFFFIIKFTAGEEYSILYDYAMNNLEEEQYIEYNVGYDFVYRNIYLLAGIGIISIITFANFHLSNLIYEKEPNIEAEAQEETTAKTSAELELENEIEKMRGRLRIKDLEKEYLALKTKLDE